MQYKIKAFGITKDIMGGREVLMEIEGKTVGDLRSSLQSQYPQLTGLRSLFIAVNQAYADDSTALQQDDEIALIPPVSGG